MSLFIFTIKITPVTCAQVLVCNSYAEHLFLAFEYKSNNIFSFRKIFERKTTEIT